MDEYFGLVSLRKDLINSKAIRSFFEFDLHIPKSNNLISKIQGWENEFLGVRDFHYWRTKNIFLVLWSDMNVVSRLDSYITNRVRLPWETRESNQEVIFSVGQLEIYKLSNDQKFAPKKISSHSFDS